MVTYASSEPADQATIACVSVFVVPLHLLRLVALLTPDVVVFLFFYSLLVSATHYLGQTSVGVERYVERLQYVVALSRLEIERVQ